MSADKYPRIFSREMETFVYRPKMAATLKFFEEDWGRDQLIEIGY